jgi:hypothetical protein
MLNVGCFLTEQRFGASGQDAKVQNSFLAAFIVIKMLEFFIPFQTALLRQFIS